MTRRCYGPETAPVSRSVPQTGIVSRTEAPSRLCYLKSAPTARTRPPIIPMLTFVLKSGPDLQTCGHVGGAVQAENDDGKDGNAGKQGIVELAFLRSGIAERSILLIAINIPPTPSRKTRPP